MILTLRSNQLTLFGTRNGYAFSEPVPQDESLAALVGSLLAWLSSNLADGEILSDVVLEQAGSVTLEDETSRQTINAAVSVTAAQGQRTFSISSESLPADLRSGLLAAWDVLAFSF